MNAIVITPRDKVEERLITALFKKMNFAFRKLSATEREDIGLASLMQNCDRSQCVKKETILKKLRD